MLSEWVEKDKYVQLLLQLNVSDQKGDFITRYSVELQNSIF